MPVFEPYLDGPDLSACVEAAESPAELNARCQGLEAYFPLWLDPRQPLGELYLEARACPRSFRYGLLGDNVLGLTWELPNGARLGLGGRVVKNVAGFDFIRLLAASRGRFGRPRRLVLRLRPRAAAERVLSLQAPLPALKRLARSIRASSWAHALDSLDLVATPEQAAVVLSFRARADLLGTLDAQAEAWAREHHASLAVLPGLVAAEPRPFARAQAPLDLLPDLAGEWLQRYGGRVHAFLGQGVLQLEVPVNPAGAEQGLHELHGRLAALGGHGEHPSLRPDPAAPQARWDAELLRRLEGLA